jgi:hypothetical protein
MPELITQVRRGASLSGALAPNFYITGSGPGPPHAVST